MRLENGIHLPPGVDPDDLDSILLKPAKEAVEFVCPVCKNRFRTEITGIEPVCTGPNLGLDEHPMEPMIRMERQ